MDFLDQWEKDLEKEKEEADKLKRDKIIKAFQEKYRFEITPEMVPALQRLEGLAVYRACGIDLVAIDSFDALWYSILREVDYYEQGEDGWNILNGNSYKGAKRWLKEYSGLCKERIPEEYKPKEE